MSVGPVANLAFYQFIELADPEAEARRVRAECETLGLRGTVLVASEGINAMLAGSSDAADAFERWLREDPRFADIEPKRSSSEEIPFGKLVVKVKPEIVTMRTPNVEAYKRTGRHLPPAKLRDWLRDREEIVLVDTRNDFEVELGTFRGATNPHTTSFSEFPDWVERHADQLRDARIVMFCTGGIRCEKATSWMLDAGFEEVYQLEGGVLKYFEEIDDAEKDWEGDLFVFDERITLDTKLRPSDGKR